MKKGILGLALLVTFSMFIAGCATIVKGSRQTISINSNVADAQVLIDGEVVGKTPLTIVLKKKVGTTVTVQKEGYLPQTKVLKTDVTGWFWGNVLIGGFFGSTTDAASGAMYEYATDSFYTTLVPEEQSEIERQHFRKTAALRRYVLMNYDHLTKEIARGEGDYLKTLMSLYEIKDPQQAIAMLQQLRSVQASAGSMVDFSDKVVNLL